MHFFRDPTNNEFSELKNKIKYVKIKQHEYRKQN
jgi:hypothetical protein